MPGRSTGAAVSRGGGPARRPATGRGPGRAGRGVELVRPERPHGPVTRPAADDLDPDLARLPVGDVRHELPRTAPRRRVPSTCTGRRAAARPSGWCGGGQPRCGRGHRRASHLSTCSGAWAGAALARRILTGMALDLPRTLTPSKVSRLHQLPARLPLLPDRAPARAAVARTRSRARWSTPRWRGSSGTTPPGARTRPRRHGELERAWDELQDDEEYVELGARPRPAPRPSSPTRARSSTTTSGWRIRTRPGRSGIELGVETRGRRHAPARHHRPPRRGARRQPDRRRLQDGAGAVGALRARQPGRGADLRAAVREPARTRPGRGPASLPAPARRHLVGAPPSRPSAASAGGPSPCGPPLSGPATPRTSGPTSVRCATTATSRPPAPPSPRDDVPRVSTHRRGGRRRLRAAPGPPGDRPGRRRRLQPGRLRAHLGAPRRPQGTPARPGPAPGRRRAGHGRVLLAHREPDGEGGGRARSGPRTTSTPRVRTPTSSSFPSGHTLAAFCTAFVLGRLRRRHGRQRGFRRRRGGQPGPPAGPSPHRRASGARPSARCSDWACAPSSTSSRPGSAGVGAGAGAGAARGMRPAEVVLEEL